MSSSMTLEIPRAASTQFPHRQHKPSPFCKGSAFSSTPLIRSTWDPHFGAINSHLLRPVELLAALGGPNPAFAELTETFTSELSTDRSPFPLPGMTTVATGQVLPASLSPAGMVASVAARSEESLFGIISHCGTFASSASHQKSGTTPCPGRRSGRQGLFSGIGWATSQMTSR